MCAANAIPTMAKVLIIEAFYGGSHKQLLTTILQGINVYLEEKMKKKAIKCCFVFTPSIFCFYCFFFLFSDIDTSTYDLFTLPAKKWHWRARTSAIYFAQTIPQNHQYQILFTTSVLNLSELIGMRMDLAKCRKIVYFHENQLIYPVREIKERDCQYGLNEIMTR